MERESLQLISAREAANILRVDPKVIHSLWRENKLDFWCINGTMKTNLNAVESFLDRNRNVVMNVQAE